MADAAARGATLCILRAGGAIRAWKLRRAHAASASLAHGRGEGAGASSTIQGRRQHARRGLSPCSAPPPPPPPPLTNRTRRVPHPALIGHAASLTPGEAGGG